MASPRETVLRCGRCVSNLLDRLQSLASEWLGGAQEPAPDLPGRTRGMVTEIDAALRLHIADGEWDVFPAVLAAAASPGRRGQAFELVSSLLIEHRDLLDLWHALRPRLLAASAGASTGLAQGAADDFLARSRRHLSREETELVDLMGLIDSTRSREIAASIAKRHGNDCSCGTNIRPARGAPPENAGG